MNFRKIKKNFRRNQKAISPVIATLLMIAIAVVASLVAYAWVMGYMSFTTGKTGKAMTIQSVAYNTAATPNLKIYVQNVGDSALNFASPMSVYVNGTSVPVTSSAGLTGPNLNVLATGSTATFNVNIAITSASPIAIKVTDMDGTIAQLSQSVP